VIGRFDAGIINNEFKRAGFEDFCAEWRSIVRNGFCTMAPSLGKWILSSFGAESKTEHGKNTMRLQDLIGILVKGRQDLKQKGHSAGADAQMRQILENGYDTFTSTCA
jgi:hypothetical protein